MKTKAYHATSARLQLPFKPYTHFGTLTAALTHLTSDHRQTVSFTPAEMEAIIAKFPAEMNAGKAFTQATFERLGAIIAQGNAALYEVSLTMKNPLSFTRRAGTTMSGAFQILTALHECRLMEEAELDYIFNKAAVPQDISMDKIKMVLKKRGHDGLAYFDPLISKTEPSYLTFFPAQVTAARQIKDEGEIQSLIGALAPQA